MIVKAARDEEPVAKSICLATITSCSADLDKVNSDDSLDEDKPGKKSFDVISHCNIRVESGRDDQGIIWSANELATDSVLLEIVESDDEMCFLDA